MIPDLGFIHKFIPSPQESPVTLLLLHGTGGSEDDMIPIAQEILPDASILSPRGKILEGGMPRFFKRLAEGVFDLNDLEFRTNELANFVKDASQEYKFGLKGLVAIGFSNGANIAASMLFLRPECIAGGVLFRPMVPLRPNKIPDLSSKSVLISSGQFDTVVPHAEVEELRDMLKKAGANVEVHWNAANHGLTEREVQTAGSWLRNLAESYKQH